MSGQTPLRVHEQNLLETLKRKEAALRHMQRERLKSVDVFKALEYVPTARQEEFHNATEYDVFYGGALGGGKGQVCPDRTAPSYDPSMEGKVLTPKGFKLVGDIKLGDSVCNPDGTLAKVIKITDNGPKQFYRVTMADGSSMEADEDHLWAYSLAGARKRRKHEGPSIPDGLRPQDEWNLRVQSRCRIANTVQLREMTLRAADQHARGEQAHYVQLPMTNPVVMTGVKGRWLVFSPYILGALVGDGSFTKNSVTISGEDPEIFDRIRAELPEHLRLSQRKNGSRCPTYGIARLDGGDTAMKLMAREGLDGKHSWEKFIPRRIKVAPVADRFAFVQGLMDTDGYMDKRGHVEYVTVSEQLAKDMQDILRSLGFRATLSTKTPTYEYKGEKLEGRLAYRLYVRGRNMDRLFHLARKRERVLEYNGGHIEPWHRVVSVVPTVVDNSRCIGVDNLNHLYVADDYIVTHNTLALLMEGIRACVRHPGIRVGAFRRTYGELKESLIKELAAHGYANSLGGKWAGSEFELRFPNRSVFMFRYAENMVDASRRLGAEFQLLLFDERTQTPADVLTFLESRLRSGDSGLPVLGIRSASNPGGPSHSAAKARYIEPTDYGQKVHYDKERKRSVRFIPSKLSDNPHLNDEYRSDLMGLPEQMRKAYLDGNWDVFEGQMFPELSYDRHIIEPVEIPATWRKYMGIDWGFASPWAALWGALDPDGRLWIYREIYQTGVGEAEQARRIRGAETRDEHISGRFADDAMWAILGDAKPIAQVYADNGVPLDKAGKGPGSRIAGWQRIHSYLEEAPACQFHQALGWETCPRMHIFSQCMKLFKELTDLPHSQTGNPEDSNPKAPDHASDALRYLTVNLGNDSKYHWPGEQRLEVTLDPTAAGPKTPAYGYNTIGGFPILGSSGDPWDL